MKIKDKLIVIIAIIAVIIVCILYPSKQVYFEGDEEIDEVISYSFTYNEEENINDILKYQKYIYTRNTYEDYLEDYLAVVICKGNKAYLNHYKVFYTKGEVLMSNEINISLASNCNFIISLPDKTKDCHWNVKKEKSTIIPLSNSKVDINLGIQDDNEQYARENLYFMSGNSGKETIVLSYESNTATKLKEIILIINVK